MENDPSPGIFGAQAGGLAIEIAVGRPRRLGPGMTRDSTAQALGMRNTATGLNHRQQCTAVFHQMTRCFVTRIGVQEMDSQCATYVGLDPCGDGTNYVTCDQWISKMMKTKNVGTCASWLHQQHLTKPS